MDLLIHISCVSDSEAMSLAMRINPILKTYGFEEPSYTWCEPRPRIEVDLVSDKMVVTRNPFITISGYKNITSVNTECEYVGFEGAKTDFREAIEDISGMPVLLV